LKSGAALNSRLSTWAAVDQWGRRLRACVRAKGGHLEHSLLSYWLRWFCQSSICRLGCYVLFKCCIAK